MSYKKMWADLKDKVAQEKKKAPERVQLYPFSVLCDVVLDIMNNLERKHQEQKEK